MSRVKWLEHEFVEQVPDVVANGTLYVCMKYATVVHRCCCGCGNEVVTPLSPTDWKLTFDGETVTLYPSIGNWSFPCQSHYWVRRSEVTWAPRWTPEQIAAGRRRDRRAKDESLSESGTGAPVEKEGSRVDFLRRILRYFTES